MSGILQTMFGGKRLVTQTFYSTATFTVPAGVTVLKSVTGKGKDGTSDTWSPNVPLGGVIFWISASQPASTSAFDGATFDQINANVDAACAAIAVGNGTIRDVTINVPGTLKTVYFPSASGAVAPSWQSGSVTATTSITYKIRGTLGALWYNNGKKVTGAIDYQNALNNAGGSSYQVRSGNSPSIEYLASLGSAGSASSAFGYVFAGGTYNSSTGVGSAATSATYANVAVTPGSSYTIGVASGGYVTITYEV